MKLAFCALIVFAPVRPGVAQRPAIDCNWLLVDTTTKTATLALVAGLTGANRGLNFDGFKEGALTFSVPLNWNVVIAFRNQDSLPHSVIVIDSVAPLPAVPAAPAFPGAMTGRLVPGIARAGTDTLRFVASKLGAYEIVCGVRGRGLAGMWIRLRVSATDKRPYLAAPR